METQCIDADQPPGYFKRLIAAFPILCAEVCVALSVTQGVQAEEVPAPDAAAESSNILSEVVVTATRRAESVQDVPIAISAFTGADLRQMDIVDPRQLTGLAPNLYVDQGLANGMTHASIRGLSSTDFSLGASAPVAIYVDDVYQASQFGLATQIYDLNRVEVLRGPQGTLFGKNTTGGSLNYYAQTPTQHEEGYVKLDGGGGDFNHYSLEGAYNQPLSDSLATRISVRVDRRNDYIENLFNGGELGHYTDFNGRGQIAWTTDGTTVNLKIFGLKSTGDGPVYIGQWLGGECTPPLNVYNKCINGVPAPDSLNSRTTYSDVPISEDYSTYGATLRVDHNIGTSALTSITGWQKGNIELLTNDTGTAGDLFHSLQQSDTSQISQEVRLATDASVRVHGVAGVFAEYDELTADQGSASTMLDPTLGYDYYQGSLTSQQTTTVAGFASITGDVTKQFSLIGGMRYSYERKHINANVADIFGFNTVTGATRDLTNADLFFPVVTSQFPINPQYGDSGEVDNTADTWHKFTWDATANLKPTDDSLLYAKVATGFRSGGFPTGLTGTNLFHVLKPETVTSYEIGFKSEWLGHTLRLNGAAFLMDYKDMQVQTNNTAGPGLILSNAASARNKGVELEIEWAPVHGLRLNGTAGFDDAVYREYVSPQGVLNGNQLPYAPRWSANLGGTYAIPVGDQHSVTLGTSWTYRSQVFFDPYNFPSTSDPSRWVGDINIGYGSVGKGWRVQAYADNVTNQNIKAFGYSIGFDAPAIYAPRLLWGMNLTYEF